jgi:hypothetical protein
MRGRARGRRKRSLDVLVRIRGKQETFASCALGGMGGIVWSHVGRGSLLERGWFVAGGGWVG